MLCTTEKSCGAVAKLYTFPHFGESSGKAPLCGEPVRKAQTFSTGEEDYIIVNAARQEPDMRQATATSKSLRHCRSPSANFFAARAPEKIPRVLHKECYNGILQLRNSLCNTVQNVRQSGL